MDAIMTGIEFFHKGGSIMYVLLLCSIFVVTIGIERAMYFSRMDTGRAFTREFYQCMANDDFAGARKLAEDHRGALANILFGAMKLVKTDSSRVSSYMEIQSGIVLSKLRKRLY